MGRMSKAVVVCILLLAASARPAYAVGEGILDYIDRLSGQGPYWGVGYEMSFLCGGGTGGGSNPGVRTLNACNKQQSRTDGPVNQWEIGPDVSYLWGRLNKNVLYPAGTPDDQKGVDAFTVGAHANYWVERYLGVTARARAVRFKGDLVENGDGLWDGMFSLGVIVRIPFEKFAIDLAPQAQFGIGPYESSQFGALSPMSDNVVKFGFHVGVRF